MRNRLERAFDESRNAADYVERYAARLRELLSDLDSTAVQHFISLLRDARDSKKTIFLAGNGGSAAVCSHLANDLGAMASDGAPTPFRAIALTDNTSFITALANDTGFENVFVNQLLSLFQPGDLLLVMSGSGNSENLVRAVRYVNEKGGISAGILGFEGGMLKSMCSNVLHIETENREYGPIEDMFMVLAHVMSTYLAFDMGLFGKPDTHPCNRVVDESTLER